MVNLISKQTNQINNWHN